MVELAATLFVIIVLGRLLIWVLFAVLSCSEAAMDMLGRSFLWLIKPGDKSR